MQPSQPSVNLKLALEWLKTINTLPVGAAGEPLCRTALFQGHSLWAGLQFIIYEELKKLSSLPPTSDQAALDRIFQSWEANTVASWRFALHKAYMLSQYLTWRMASRLAPRGLLVYTPDIIDPRSKSDFRFAKVYDLLRKKGIGFREVLHSVGLRRSLANRLQHGQALFYLETFGGFRTGTSKPPAYDDAHLHPLLRAWLTRRLPAYFWYARSLAEMVPRLARAMEGCGVRCLLGMDDLRAMQPLLMACRFRGIKTVLVQHGLLTRYHAGWSVPGVPENLLCPVDRFLVHAPYWQSVLTRFAPHLAKGSMVVSGWNDFSLPAKAARPSGGRADQAKPKALLLYETLWPDLDEVREFAGRLAAEKRVELWFKIRPDLDRDQQVADYFPGTIAGPDQVVIDLPPQELADMQVIVGSHSSLLYYLLASRIPVVRIESSYDFGDQLVDDGLADPWPREMSAWEVLQRAAGRDRSLLTQRRDTFFGTEPQPNFQDVLVRELAEVGI